MLPDGRIVNFASATVAEYVVSFQLGVGIGVPSPVLFKQKCIFARLQLPMPSLIIAVFKALVDVYGVDKYNIDF